MVERWPSKDSYKYEAICDRLRNSLRFGENDRNTSRKISEYYKEFYGSFKALVWEFNWFQDRPNGTYNYRYSIEETRSKLAALKQHNKQILDKITSNPNYYQTRLIETTQRNRLDVLLNDHAYILAFDLESDLINKYAKTNSLKGADFKAEVGANNLEGCNFSGANLTASDFSYTIIESGSLDGCIIEGARFTGAQVSCKKPGFMNRMRNEREVFPLTKDNFAEFFVGFKGKPVF